ncbi:uroporphyrinogen-III synthase [Xanthobacter sp. TB0139]|uniref:uroporphyrinogen-III synthase n=1 Tax=Xanthobacter sp. TB0139 TaxID=3459178 RepID=UPI00403A33B4
MLTLVTRPRPAAEETAARLRALGHEVLMDPMLHIRHLPEGLRKAMLAAPFVSPFDVLAFTSINGVDACMAAMAAAPEGPAWFQALSPLPVYAVGTRTAQAVRQAGFSTIITCAGDARDMTRRMAQDLPADTRILYPAALHRAADLPAALAPHGLHVTISEVYAAETARTLAQTTRDALAEGQIECVLHYSQRTATALLSCVAAAGLMHRLSNARHLCLSAQVAGPLVAAGLQTHLAGAPSEEALLALL